jgi:acetyl-CoA synthetase
VFGLSEVEAAMEWKRIRKQPADCIAANLLDYDQCARTFSWAQARSLLDGLPGGGLNIAHEALDRHVQAGRGGKLALRWIGRDDQIKDFTYAALAAAANRFANVLARNGVGKGDRVFSLLGRVPELYAAIFGTLKNGSVFSPLFSAFGPEPIKARMTIGDARVLVTTEAFYRRKVEAWRNELPGLEYVFLTECSPSPPPGTIELAAALAKAPDTFETIKTSPIWRCCTLPAARRVGRKVPCTCTRRSSRTTSRAGSRSIFAPTISSGAPPIPAG